MYLSLFSLASILAAQFLLIAVVVGFTKPSSVIIRTLGLACTIILMLVSVFSQKATCDSFTQMYLYFTPPSLALQYINIALLRHKDFDYAAWRQSRATKDKSSPDTALERLMFGLQAASGRRYCAQTIEIPNVPRFRKSDADFIPSTRRFLVHRGLVLFAGYLYMDFLGILGGLKAEKTPAATPSLFFSIGDLTMEKVAEHIFLAAMIWAGGLLTTTLHFGVPGYLLVLFGLSEPKSWRPVVNLAHGMPYSIRRFWSHYWHLCNKDILYQPAKFVADDILHLRKCSAVRRYMIIIFTFAASGLLHVLVDASVGVPLAQSRSMGFFLGQAFAIVLEDAVSYGWMACTGQEPSDTVPRWQVWIGRIWVALLLCWTTAPWMWPMLQHIEDGEGVPISILKRLQA